MIIKYFLRTSKTGEYFFSQKLLIMKGESCIVLRLTSRRSLAKPLTLLSLLIFPIQFCNNDFTSENNILNANLYFHAFFSIVFHNKYFLFFLDILTTIVPWKPLSVIQQRGWDWSDSWCPVTQLLTGGLIQLDRSPADKTARYLGTQSFG